MCQAVNELFADEIQELKEKLQIQITEGKQNRDKEMITNMLNNGKSAAAISEFCGYPLELVQKIEAGLLTTAK